MAVVLPLDEAIAGLVDDGDTVTMEGFTHLIPFAAGHEIIRQGRRHLTLARMTPDVIYDQMIGAGCARRLIFSWGGNPGVGSLHRFRDAVENGWPVPLELEEHSHAGMANRYVAGACGLPFAVLGDVVLPTWAVTSVSVAPGGAHPSYAQGYSDRDNDSASPRFSTTGCNPGGSTLAFSAPRSLTGSPTSTPPPSSGTIIAIPGCGFLGQAEHRRSPRRARRSSSCYGRTAAHWSSGSTSSPALGTAPGQGPGSGSGCAAQGQKRSSPISACWSQTRGAA